MMVLVMKVQQRNCSEEEDMVIKGGDCDDTNPNANDTTNDSDCDGVRWVADCDNH